MFIAYQESGRGLVACVGAGVAPEEAARAIGLAPGAWREVAPEEAAALRAPTPEELAARRIAEIRARLDELDAASIRPLRALAKNMDAPEDMRRLAAIEAEAAGLRAELQARAAPEAAAA